MTSTVAALCESAAHALNLILPGESLNPNDGARFLRRLNHILDYWNAKREAIYAIAFSTFTLTPTLSPHTIGPTGTWVTGTRPVSLESDPMLLVAAATTSQVPITRRDRDWYGNLAVPTVQSSIPTDVFYNPAWPNGELYFYPVPTTAYQVSLELRVVLSTVVMTDTITLPQGYLGALENTLTEQAASDFGRKAPESIVTLARDQRAAIFANNDPIPSIETLDAGMPTQRAVDARGTYLTRWQ